MQISSGGTEALAIMARTGLATIVFVLTHVLHATRSNSANSTKFCAYYDIACTPNSPPNQEPLSEMSCAKHRLGWENCTREPGEPEHDIVCLSVYAPFQNDTLHYRRCFAYHQGVPCKCTRLEHCCCRGNFCNNVTLNAPRTPNPDSSHSTGATTSSPLGASTQSPTDSDSHSNGNRKSIVIAVSLCCSLLILALVLILALWYYCVWYKDRHVTGIPDEDRFIKSDFLDDDAVTSLDDVALRERVGLGRFAEVWRVDFGARPTAAAVKIFLENERTSWRTEVDTYANPMLKHPGILNFWAAERRQSDESGGVEYWLLTDYHERGSLNDFLKLNVVERDEMCTLAGSLAAGLAYLHGKGSADGIRNAKPGIAHRDLKSRNVLIKDDGTCCISDFGLAVKFKVGQGVAPAHGQVGTVRYMAPEVLEGAIHFQEEAFLRTDIYALGLIMWEIGWRCAVGNGLVVEYQQPYEDSVSGNPSIEEMHEVVVINKLRPSFSSEWHCNESLDILRETIEECWDSDAEARLTADCVKERIKQCQAIMNNTPLRSTFNNGKTVEVPVATSENGNGAARGARVPNGIHPIPPAHYHRDSHVPNMSAAVNGVRQCTQGGGGGGGGGVGPVMLPVWPSSSSRGTVPYKDLVFDSSSSSCPPPYSPTPNGFLSEDTALRTNIGRKENRYVEEPGSLRREDCETSV